MTQYDDSLLASELFFLFLTPFVYIYQSQVIKMLTDVEGILFQKHYLTLLLNCENVAL